MLKFVLVLSAVMFACALAKPTDDVATEQTTEIHQNTEMKDDAGEGKGEGTNTESRFGCGHGDYIRGYNRGYHDAVSRGYAPVHRPVVQAASTVNIAIATANAASGGGTSQASATASAQSGSTSYNG